VHWIERWLHFSPDGGNGYVEWVIVLFVAFLVAAAVWRRVSRTGCPSASRPSEAERGADETTSITAAIRTRLLC